MPSLPLVEGTCTRARAVPVQRGCECSALHTLWDSLLGHLVLLQLNSECWLGEHLGTKSPQA
jgi:hypothetical protein